GRSRKLPIEPELRPLLKALSKERAGKRVFHMPSAGVLSSKLKHYIERAGITWAAASGDDALRIMQRAGHSSFSTTQIYIREAENLGASFGRVFPPLP